MTHMTANALFLSTGSIQMIPSTMTCKINRIIKLKCSMMLSVHLLCFVVSQGSTAANRVSTLTLTWKRTRLVKPFAVNHCFKAILM